MKENIYQESKNMSRRDFLKLISGIGATYITSGCLNIGNSRNETPTPTETPKKKFTSELRIEGDEEFKRNVEHMLKVLEEYSPEWYEKTMYAGEVIKPGKITGASKTGEIYINKEHAKLSGNNDIKMVLLVNSVFPHEVQHIIDRNVYEKWSNIRELDILESELRAGIAGGIYSDKIKEKDNIDLYSEVSFGYSYEHMIWAFEEDMISLKVDQVKYKNEIEVIEQKYFDHKNKRLKIEFLDESWNEFKKI